MKIIDVKSRRKGICGIVFNCEIDPKEYGADSDPVGLLSLDAELCEIKHLKQGVELTDEELTALVRASHIKRAKSRAMWYVSRSDHAKKVLIDKLKRSFPEYAAIKAAERLEELGLIDDEAYAKRRLARILEEKHVSIRMAKQLLHAEGIDSEIIELVAEDTEYDADNQLIELIEKKYKRKIGTKEDTKKTVAALMRKGYNYSEVKQALEHFNCEADFSEDY